ncbi:hypothetical protein Tco_0348199 [Tanacetum coccineum]
MVDIVPGLTVIDTAQRKRDAVILLKRIRKFIMAKDIGTRAAVHIFNRISIAIAKGVGLRGGDGGLTAGWSWCGCDDDDAMVMMMTMMVAVGGGDGGLWWGGGSAWRRVKLLVYVSATCPSSSKQSEKLIAVTPINKNKKVRFAEPSTSSSNTQKLVDSCKTKDSNKLLLPSTGVISSTSASGSKPPGNTMKNRISRPTSSNKKNRVEDHLRSVKSSLNKKNRVYEPVCNVNAMHSVLNANSELICATCNECMFDAIHDLCVLDYLNDVNVHVTSKPVKSKKKKVWKSIGLPPKNSLSTTVVKKSPLSSNTSGKL